MGCEKEGPTWVHLDSKVGWVERMHLCIEGSIKIAYWKIEMFHLPSHSISLITQLNICKIANGATTGSKQVSVLGFAVEVVDKQGDDSPFLVIKDSKELCQQFCTQRGELHTGICHHSVKFWEPRPCF